MCDTLVHAAPGGPVWLAKNSDREPDEAQAVDRTGPEDPVRTDMSPEPPPALRGRPRHAAVLSRPAWMWGCEMGVNARGLAVANEAVFTRLPVPDAGLTGMDLQRHALEQCATAEEALARIVELLARHPQGGRMARRSRRLRYHSSFVLADPREAWVLETAGPFWAARRVGAWTLSNALTLGDDAERVHPDAYAFARRRGWCRRAGEFSFARCFGDPLMTALAGAAARRACTAGHLRAAGTSLPALIAALRDHDGRPPTRGLRMTAPCAHAHWLPTRAAGQTTASMIARLGAPPAVWMTGGPAPCLGVFKPVHLDAAPTAPPGERPGDDLWWRQSALHGAVLRDYAARRARFAGELDVFQETCLLEHAPADLCAARWAAHRELARAWLARVRA